MNDSILEYIIEKKPGVSQLLIRCIIAFGVVFIFLLSFAVLSILGFAPYSLVFLFAACMLGYYLWKYTSVEYEVCIVENAMMIDIIYGRDKRKQVLSLDLSKLEMAALYTSDAARYYDNNDVMRSYVFVSDNLDNSILLVMGFGASNIRLYLENNDRIMNYITKRYPSKVRR